MKTIELLLTILFAIILIALAVRLIVNYKNNKQIDRNPYEGKKVVFVFDESEKENSEGVRGHLEVVGESGNADSLYDACIKKILDFLISLCGLIVLFPVFAVIMIAIYIDDPGPVIFKQKRIGKNKKYFYLHKFRSMKMCTPKETPTHMLDNPEFYITKVGGFIRRHSLDELPQIWDILVGNMSIIGPRPALWNQDYLVAERDKYGANDVTPGLTGWAQINGRDELKIEEKAKLDGEYAENIGFFMDAKCFIGSIKVIFKDDTVVEGKTHIK